MSSDPAGQPSGQAAGSRETVGQPTEEELRAAYEAELSRITPADVMLQAAVSLLNLGARRLGLTGEGESAQASGSSSGTSSGTPGGPAGGSGASEAGAPGGGRDLAQVRDAIDGARALLAVLEQTMPEELRPLRDALAQLQMTYAREANAAGPAQPAGEQARPAEGKDGEESDEPPGGPGPAQASGRLWVPGS